MLNFKNKLIKIFLSARKYFSFLGPGRATGWSQARAGRYGCVLMANFLILPCVMALCAEAEAMELQVAEPVQEAVAVRKIPHDPAAFTEGLVFCRGRLIESTGRYGESLIKEIDIDTGRTLRTKRVDKSLFGEGIALLGTRLFQLTWREETALVYDVSSLALTCRRAYRGEGWGLATDGKRLIMSNGTDVIRIIEPETFRTVRTIRVRSRSRGALYFLNELEYINGEIWANIWKKAEICRIDPEDGTVKGWVRLERLIQGEEQGEKPVFNGIAWDSRNRRLFIALKLWPWIYEVRLVPFPSPEQSPRHRKSH